MIYAPNNFPLLVDSGVKEKLKDLLNIIQELLRSKPSTIDALKAIVEEFILSIDPDTIRK